MKIWKDKEGKWIDTKEFMERFKKGVEGITQLQQIKGQISSMWIMIIGILCGLVISIIGIRNLWWLGIILSAALFNTSIQLLGLWQKKVMLERIENMLKIEDTKEVEDGKEITN